MHWGLLAFGSIREPRRARAEVALALLATARTSRAHAQPKPSEVPIKAENKRFRFYTPNQTARLLLRVAFLFIGISREVYLYRMHRFTRCL